MKLALCYTLRCQKSHSVVSPREGAIDGTEFIAKDSPIPPLIVQGKKYYRIKALRQVAPLITEGLLLPSKFKSVSVFT